MAMASIARSQVGSLRACAVRAHHGGPAGGRGRRPGARRLRQQRRVAIVRCATVPATHAAKGPGEGGGAEKMLASCLSSCYQDSH